MRNQKPASKESFLQNIEPGVYAVQKNSQTLALNTRIYSLHEYVHANNPTK